MEHPTAIRPDKHAVFAPDKMGKATLFRSERIMVGLNAFEPGQQHALHAHEDMDKVYHVLSGRGCFLLEDREIPMEAGTWEGEVIGLTGRPIRIGPYIFNAKATVSVQPFPATVRFIRTRWLEPTKIWS